MKKIVVNGGNFYEAFLVAKFENVSLAANTFMTLVDTPNSDYLYLFEVTRTPQSDLAIHNGKYVVTNQSGEYAENENYSCRVYSTSSPILLKSFNTGITISVNVYQCKKYVPVRLPITGSSAYDYIGSEKATIYQFPLFESGKTYSVKVTTLYSGHFAFYQDGLRYENENAVENTTYSFEYTATGSGTPYIRDWSNNTNHILLEINEK